MSWGERSCLNPCRCPESCSMSTCDVNCSGYVWDGITPPDSTTNTDNGTHVMKSLKNEPHPSGLNRSERRKMKKQKMTKYGSDGNPVF